MINYVYVIHYAWKFGGGVKISIVICTILLYRDYGPRHGQNESIILLLLGGDKTSISGIAD